MFPFRTVEEIRETIARSIGLARRRKGLSQTDLAQAISDQIGRPLDPSQVSDWETGKNLPRLDMVVAMARSLKVSTDQLILGEEDFIRQIARVAAEEARSAMAGQVRELEDRIERLAERKR